MTDEFDEERVGRATGDQDELLSMRLVEGRWRLESGGVVRVTTPDGEVLVSTSDMRKFLRTVDAAEVDG